MKIEGLSFAYGAKQALDDISLTIAPGTFCALLGPNGAGKSTLFALLTRLFTTAEGRITIGGHDLAKTPRAALAQMGVVFQQTTLDLDLTIRQNLRYFAALHGLSGREASRRIDAALDQLDLTARASEKCRTLNGGHKRRTEIARALLHSPSFLLLDEATVGLDAATRADITAHVHALAAEKNLTVLWATHLTDEVEDHDQLAILHRGQLLTSGRTAELRQSQSLSDYFLSLTSEPA
ncbi:ABC transporter ATP-binding protein [Primorskyibacter aestuariivivens]|uniref:ABC transporter ATP-binding protein n=1 Tax=Primorskyibacter aestuariivivens TaxID=1888912 RepID=UPI0023008D2A|nr:ABC transporter ATP-binding protein [Primorskyibacter aestuariivivens]MDA7428473.1 ABC transporter ATP-binding protein [Primorskyibacter aestuariivivens]